MKDQITSIPDEALDAWESVGFFRYKMKADIARKAGTGEEARWHVGFVAQQIEEAFVSTGSDAFDYGLLCRDSWKAKPEVLDEQGNVVSAAREAGSRYSVRYEEALSMEAALLRRTKDQLVAEVASLRLAQQDLERRLCALESK